MTSFREVATFLDPVRPPTSLRALLAMHRFRPSDPVSFASICNRHAGHDRVDARFLWLNTFLLNTGLGILGKPWRPERARAIAELIRDHFDIAALCEVFHPDEGDILRERLKGSRPVHTSGGHAGPAETAGLFLAVLGAALQMSVSPPAEVEFDAESGDDAKADKGVRRIEVWPGPGFGANLEVYCTHLQNEDGPVALKQVKEFVTKIFPAMHRPENAAILAGDFNLEASSADGMKARDLLASIGFRDLWSTRNGTPGFTDIDGPVPVTEALKTGVTPIADAVGPPEAPGSIFCDDFKDASKAAVRKRRIDYLFALDPSPEQRILVDFTRPRRVRPPFHDLSKQDLLQILASHPQSPPDVMNLASDHLGLTTVIRFSPG